jgi:hypothetical protein
MCRNEFYVRFFGVLALAYLIPNRKGSIIQYTVCTVEYYCKVSVQSSELGLPTSSPPSECVPPMDPGGHTRLQGRGLGDPIPTTGQKLWNTTVNRLSMNMQKEVLFLEPSKVSSRETISLIYLRKYTFKDLCNANLSVLDNVQYCTYSYTINNH